MTPDSPAIHAPLPVTADKDTEHLKLLAIFQFVLGGFALAVTAFLALHFLMMRTLLTDPEFNKAQGGNPFPQVFMDIMLWVYVVLGVYFVVSSAASILCGIFLLKQKVRGFCMTTAILQCTMVPLGTILGVFTMTALNRPSVQAKFAS